MTSCLRSLPWWRADSVVRAATAWADNAVIYQIYPLSFFDSTATSAGDLRGIIAKLDYLVALGVDALWLSPIYESPLDDFGYDPVDQCNVEPLIGSLDDFRDLLSIAHGCGLRVLVDQIWNHTSDQHRWFLDSASSRDSDKSDWYVWADPGPDGGPPNNWRSAFNGGPAWGWNEEREQYYFFNFLPSQPKLNWHNPEVVNALVEIARFWLEQGVDGFRVDAANFVLHDAELRDNPPRDDDDPMPEGVPPDNPFAQNRFVYDFCRPEAPRAFAPFRRLVDRYPGAVLLGEVTLAEDSVQLASDYVGEQRLHHVYTSALLAERPITARLLADSISRVHHSFSGSGNCWMVGNHDYGRLRSRWASGIDGQPYPDRFYELIAAVLMSLPGPLCLWQGDELGLPEARIPEDIAPHQIQDPFGQALYPDVLGRDGSRTPMPWDSTRPNAGFSDAREPWLPIPEHHLARAVDIQSSDPTSLLNAWRRLLHWRRAQPALRTGSCSVVSSTEPVLQLVRESERQCLSCIFNVSAQPAVHRVRNGRLALVSGLCTDVDRVGDDLHLPPWGFAFGNLPTAVP